MKIFFRKLDPRAVIPEYASIGASGLDLVAIDNVTVLPHRTALVNTGLAVELPAMTEIQIRPRGGWSKRSDLWIRNSPATVDSDYRGPLLILVYNGGSEPIEVFAGDKIAQAVVCPILQPRIAEALSETARRPDHADVSPRVEARQNV